MKSLTKYNRVAGYLNQIFDALNADFFAGELKRPVITIQSTPKAYGHFTLFDAWSIKGEGHKEINLGAGTLDRPIEYVVTTLLHEMVHYHNYLHGIQDCSNRGVYHNARFRDAAEMHGLVVSRSEKYGRCITEPSDSLIEWCITQDLADIQLNRNELVGLRIAGTGGKAANGSAVPPPRKKSSYIRYVCPCCGVPVRATRKVNLICADCNAAMIES